MLDTSNSFPLVMPCHHKQQHGLHPHVGGAADHTAATNWRVAGQVRGTAINPTPGQGWAMTNNDGTRHKPNTRHSRKDTRGDAALLQPQQQDAGFASNATDGQHLLTVGTRLWGNWWDGRGLLRVKIYDFAIYVDSQQVSFDASEQQLQHTTHSGMATGLPLMACQCAGIGTE